MSVKRKSIAVAVAAAFFFVSTIYNVHDRLLVTMINLTTESKSSSSSSRDRSVLYGLPTYPIVTSQNQTWTWMIQFLQSLPQKQFLSPQFNGRTPSKNPYLVHSVRFADTKTADVEDKYLSSSQQTPDSRHITDIPVYDCRVDACQKNNAGQTVFRPEELPPIYGHHVIVHASQGDVYDLGRVLASLEASVQELLLVVTIAPTRATKTEWEDDDITPLYDLLHRLFFELNWIPTSAAQNNCNPAELLKGCQFWIAWKPYRPDETLRYLPPAGDGSPEMELQRYAALLNNPREHACRVKQVISGVWSEESTLDGGYWVCLDNLRIAAAKGTCLVYEFGVRADWSFGDALDNFGCEVHSFDPSTGTLSLQRSPRHWFHNIGIATNTSKVVKGWKMETFEEIRRNLGHTGRKIDLLKMDPEGAEWSFLNSILHDPTFSLIGQFIIESHEWGVTKREGWAEHIREKTTALHNIEKRDFVLFSSKRFTVFPNLRAMDFQHPVPVQKSTILYELGFLNQAYNP